MATKKPEATPKRLPPRTAPTARKLPIKPVAKKVKLPSRPLPMVKKLPIKKVDEIADLDASSLPTLWIYKCNIKSEHRGDWAVFFGAGRRGNGEWGGTWSTDSNASRKRLFEDVQVNDLMLAWQSDRQEAVGLCRVADLPYDHDYHGEISTILETRMVFTKPIKLLKLKKVYPALKYGTGFQPGGGTIFATTSEEAKLVYQLCGVPASLLTS